MAHMAYFLLQIGPITKVVSHVGQMDVMDTNPLKWIFGLKGI